MRTVLAIDEMLARAVAKILPGNLEYCCRDRMRSQGDDIVRELVLAEPCVLVIGGSRWNPLGLLERWGLPATTPVVLLLPRLTRAMKDRTVALGAHSVLSAGRSRKLPTLVSSECLVAHGWAAQPVREPLLRVVARLASIRPATPRKSPLLRLGA